MTTVILTSFKKLKHYGHAEPYSIAVFQPKGFNLPSLPFLFPVDERGCRIMLEHYTQPGIEYPAALRQAYRARWTIIQKWMRSLLERTKDLALCCWCPYTQIAKQEIKIDNCFYCHSGLIAKMLVKHCPQVSVLLDDDRKNGLAETWSLPMPPSTCEQLLF